ncbi:MAG TPA: hypothetical protein DEB39_00490 [Planctomycetaceae bacterium]|nr:hypothetical protein [Planctomycetaceae bacterium]
MFAKGVKLLVVSLPFFFVVGVLSAQPIAYQTWAVDAAQEGRRDAVIASLGRPSLDDRPGVEQFFKSYYIARWTDAANESQLATYRRELLKDDCTKVHNNNRAYLLGLIQTQMASIAENKDIFPAGRYNAILTIGMLSEKEESGSTPPVVYAEALPYLVKTSTNEEMPPYIRVGALGGVVRHAQAGIADAARRNDALALFCRIIVAGKPKEDRPVDEQQLLDWSREKAIEGIQGLRLTGARQEGLATLLEVAESPAETPQIRYLAVRALGDLDFEAAVAAGAEVPFQKIATVIIELAKFTCQNEPKLIQEALMDSSVNLANLQQGGSGRPMMPVFGMGAARGGGPPGAANPAEYEMISESISRLKFAFSSFRNGLLGRNSRVSGADNATGILPFLKDDPAERKINNTARLFQTFMEVLDQGPAPAAKPAPGTAAQTVPVDPKAPKVTLQDIVEELEALLEKINANFPA